MQLIACSVICTSNLKTAKTLGLDLSASLQARARPGGLGPMIELHKLRLD
jgi:hypothetical protein